MPALLLAVAAAMVALPIGSSAQVRVIRSSVAAPAPAPLPAGPPPAAVLRWNNGETASGEIAEATAAALTWKTSLFEDPLLLDWRALHRIDHALPGGTPDGPFHITLRDGSHFYGDLGVVSTETVTVRSARCGEVALRRSEVLSVQRIKGARLVFVGPAGDAGWVPVLDAPPDGGQQNGETPTKPAPALGDVPTQVTGPAGAMVLPFWHRTAFLALPLPPCVDVEFRLHSRDQPAFQLALDGDGKRRLRVETWDDELVLTSGDFFLSLRKLDAKEREIALRVRWDSASGLCQVYTPEGQLLQECTLPEEKSAGDPGVRLQNKGHDLSLDLLRVRVWEKQIHVWESNRDVSSTNLGQPRVTLDDGRTLAGTVSLPEGGAVTVTPPDGGPATSVPLDEVDTLVLAAGDPSAASPRGAVLTYADGTFLRGELAGIKEGGITLKTSFTEALLTAKTEALRRLFLPVPDPKQDLAPGPATNSADAIVLHGTTLHGRMVASSGEAQPRWLPVGGLRPALPTRTLPFEITCTVPARSLAPDAGNPITLIYTRMGDALPGVLHGLDRAELDFDSPLVETKKLPSGEWQEARFNVNARAAIEGFSAPGWRLTKTEVGKDDTLNLKEGSAASHLAAMLNGEVKFSYGNASFSSIRLRMFYDGSNPKTALNYVILRNGNSMSTGVETSDDFSSSNRTTVSSGPVAVRLTVDENGVRCFFNNALAETLPFPIGKRAGTGLVIEPADVWGNGVRDVQVSKFSSVAEVGQAAFQNVNLDVKTQALTVPRFRKEDLPRHALVATTGDLLRGEVEAITNTQFGFRIGLEALRVPRERVSAVIALQKPADGPAPPPDEKSATRKLLARSVNQQTWYSAVNFGTLIDLVKEAVPELKFTVPEDDGQRAQHHFNNESISDTLDALCEAFDLRYRVDGGGIVIERKGVAQGEPMLRKPYWLKTDLPDSKVPLTEMLSAKGIPFPAEAAARWQPAARCLEVTNTAANQDKAAEVLEREFGGVAALPPTHWLLLTSGGRIGLRVDKFGPDAVTGTHPIYGRCTVPLAEVRSVYNTLPDVMAAGSSSDVWRLAYAPEPVLPESGGEGSALLGKEAPVFKLKMLEEGAGEFDLSQQKGNIVVLDFWATWCGPCIKSLPGLIETMGQFPAEKVKLVGLNQAEAPEQVRRFLETRGWKLAVAMDAGQNVAKQYGVDGIPHTVVVGPDGKVAWVRTGYSPDGEAALAEQIKKLLAGVGAASPGEPVAGAKAEVSGAGAGQ